MDSINNRGKKLLQIQIEPFDCNVKEADGQQLPLSMVLHSDERQGDKNGKRYSSLLVIQAR